MSVSSVERPVNALRQRMLEDMAMRSLRSDTQRDYIRFMRSFAAFLGQAPDTATAEDIRRFQVHQRESGVQPPTINCSVSALRFFFTVTLDRPDLSRRLVLARYPRKLPAVLSVEEVGQLLGSAPGRIQVEQGNGRKDRQARLLRRPGRSHRQAPLPAPPRAGQEEAMGGLCQGAVHRPRGCARLSLALHPPGRHLQSASDRLR
ncbi:transposase (fragment) [Methylocella tundrae]|uniref:Transposase n=1 Tax=Methylocella tundrae TaxID=227605 RepID=A0A8B6M2Y7_METTU